MEQYYNATNELKDVIVKKDSNLIHGKKKRGRPKKIKNPDNASTLEIGKIDCSSEVTKKRRGRPKKLNQYQKSSDRDVKKLEHQQHYHQYLSNQQLSYLEDSCSDASNCFSPSMISSPKSIVQITSYPRTFSDNSHLSQSTSNGPLNLGQSQKQSCYNENHHTHVELDLYEKTDVNSTLCLDNNLRQEQLQQQHIYSKVEHSSLVETPCSGYISYNEKLHKELQQSAPTPQSQITDEHSHHSHSSPPHTLQLTPTHSMSPRSIDQFGKLNK